MDTCRKRLLLVFLLASALVCQAQKPVIGYFEFKDERSGAVGLRKHFTEYDGVEARFFDISRPETFRVEEYDVIMFGSFSEFHPSWNDFVRREKERLLAQVRRGAMLILFNRHRRNDDKLTLLPSGYSVKRSNKDFREIYFYEVAHPMWRGMTRRPSRGWHRLTGGKIGRKDQPAFLDAFEDWSRNFRKSAGPEKRGRGGWAAALSAEFGQGEMMLLQLTYDKLEEATGRRSRAAAREFFKAMTVYIGRRPSFPKVGVPSASRGTAPPRADRERPGRTVQPPRVDPPPRKTTVTLRARVFDDADGDGDHDVGEPPVVGAFIVDGNGRATTGTDGRALTDASRRTDRTIHVEVPDGFDITSGWFVDVPFTAVGDEDALDVLFPLTRLPASRTGRLVIARLDSRTASSVMADLSSIQGVERPDAVILLADGAALRGFGSGLETLADDLAGAGLPIRLLTASPRPGFGPSEAAFRFGGVRFLTAGRSDAAVRITRFGKARDAVVLVADPVPESSAAEILRAGARRVVAGVEGTAASVTSVPTLAAEAYLVVDLSSGRLVSRLGPEVVASEDGQALGEEEGRDAGSVTPAPEVEAAPSFPVRETHPHVKGSLEEAVRAAGGEVAVADESVPLDAKDVFAHRGGAGEAPANTFTAVERALATGCGGVEVDVRLTGDGQLIVLQRETVPSGNGDLSGKRVNSVPFFELSKMDVGTAERRESPPLLEDLRRLPWGKTRLMIDAKSDGDADRLGEACARLAKSWGKSPAIDLASQDAGVLKAFHREAPDVPLVAMIEKAADVPRFDGLPIAAWSVRAKTLDSTVAAFLSKGGRGIRIGVVNDIEQARELLAVPGVTAVVTDKPATLLGR